VYLVLGEPLGNRRRQLSEVSRRLLRP